MSSSRPKEAGGWAAPACVGVVVALLVWWVAGSLVRPAVIEDESAYLLQAGIFAHGHWTSLSPPLPEFFEQIYVLVTPVLASKYPPGQSLALVPGVWLGLPGLMPIILSGVTAALLYALGRRIAGQWVAILAVLIWVSMFETLYARVMYMSEVTTAATWLLAWWGMLRWRDRGSLGALAVCGLAVGWTLITRPLTGVALAIPLAIALAARVVPQRAWRPAVVALGATMAIVAIIPLWNVRTTGHWNKTPLGLYTRLYMPFDGPGFGAGAQRPLRPVPADLAAIQQQFYMLHRDHHLAAMPRDLIERTYYLGRAVWGGGTVGWRMILLPFVIVGLVLAGPEIWLALATVGLLLVLYLLYPHPPYYTLYYLEGETVLALVTAVGIVRLIQRLPQTSPRLRVGLLASAAAALVLATAPAASAARAVNRGDTQFATAFSALIAPLTSEHAGRSIVFVDYKPDHNSGLSVINNVPDERDAQVWIVHERGAADARLLAAAPDRTPYRFDEATWTLTALESPARLRTPPRPDPGPESPAR